MYEKSTGKAGTIVAKPEVLSVVMGVVTDFPETYAAVQDALRDYRAKYRQQLCKQCGDVMERELFG